MTRTKSILTVFGSLCVSTALWAVPVIVDAQGPMPLVPPNYQYGTYHTTSRSRQPSNRVPNFLNQARIPRKIEFPAVTRPGANGRQEYWSPDRQGWSNVNGNSITPQYRYGDTGSRSNSTSPMERSRSEDSRTSERSRDTTTPATSSEPAAVSSEDSSARTDTTDADALDHVGSENQMVQDALHDVNVQDPNPLDEFRPRQASPDVMGQPSQGSRTTTSSSSAAYSSPPAGTISGKPQSTYRDVMGVLPPDIARGLGSDYFRSAPPTWSRDSSGDWRRSSSQWERQPDGTMVQYRNEEVFDYQRSASTSNRTQTPSQAVRPDQRATARNQEQTTTRNDSPTNTSSEVSSPEAMQPVAQQASNEPDTDVTGVYTRDGNQGPLPVRHVEETSSNSSTSPYRPYLGPEIGEGMADQVQSGRRNILQSPEMSTLVGGLNVASGAFPALSLPAGVLSATSSMAAIGTATNDEQSFWHYPDLAMTGLAITQPELALIPAFYGAGRFIMSASETVEDDLVRGIRSTRRLAGEMGTRAAESFNAIQAIDDLTGRAARPIYPSQEIGSETGSGAGVFDNQIRSTVGPNSDLGRATGEWMQAQ